MAPDSHRNSKPGTHLTASKNLSTSLLYPQVMHLCKDKVERERELEKEALLF